MISGEWLTDDLSDAVIIRRRVFLDECGMDTDISSDDGAQVLLVRDDGVPVATGRVLGRILGLIAVLPEYRSKAYGDFVVRLLIRRAYELGEYTQYVYSRPQAVGFYKRLGFELTGRALAEEDGFTVELRHTGDVSGNC